MFETFPIVLYQINKLLAVECQKLLNLLKAFQNWQIQSHCSYWMTDFSELHQELLKAGKG
jgi:hypothetical protein